MARDSGGTYTAPTNSVNPAVEGTVIDENDFNELVADVVAALTDSLDRTGKGKITAHIDFDENGSPGTPATNVGRLYVADVGGVTTLKFKDNAGTDYNLLLTSPGLAYAFETTADTTTNPGSGNIRFDNAAIASTTEIAVSDTDSNGSDLSAFIASWDDSTSLAARGRLIIQNRTAPANVAIFTINGASTDESGWTRLAVAYVTHNGSFGAAAPLGVTFVPAGNAGLDGVSAGLLYSFATDTTTTSDPGAGNIRLNNASFASVTEIALADTSANSGNPDVSAFVLTWDDSTSSVRGLVTLKKATALANFATYSISGASTDEAGWVRLAVTHVDSNGSFSANDPIGVEFVRTGDKGDTGNTGSIGAPGANGTDPGIRWSFDDSTTTNADPGSGDLRLNNAALASVTEIAISYSSGETSNPSVEEWVKAWDDSTTTGNRGTLIIKKPSAPQNFAVYSITSAITDGTTYGRFTLSHIVSAGSFAASDVLAVQFSRTGDKGLDGAGTGDVVGPASSVDGEIALFDSTTGKLLKRATTTGLLKAASGVISAATSGTDYAPATSGTSILKGDGSGGFSNATAGTDYYSPGGTDVSLADGGTGASLSDPNADRLLFWDDSAGAVTWLEAGSGLTISGTTITAAGGGGSNSVADGRLTLTSGVPVLSSSVSAAATLYYTPYIGNTIALYSGSAWAPLAFTETSIALSGGTASRVHDVFAYDNSGALALELLAWTDNTTRATALARQNGVLVKSGDATRRYIGSVYLNASQQIDYLIPTTAASGGSQGFIGLWNMYNRVQWSCMSLDSDNTWSYATAAWRASNASNSKRTTFVVGLEEDAVSASHLVWSTGSSNGRCGVALDATNTATGITAAAVGQANTINGRAEWGGVPAIGLHYLQAVEYGAASLTFYGDNGSFATSGIQSGLIVTGRA